MARVYIYIFFNIHFFKTKHKTSQCGTDGIKTLYFLKNCVIPISGSDEIVSLLGAIGQPVRLVLHMKIRVKIHAARVVEGS